MKRDVPTNTDEIVAWCPLPTGGKLLGAGVELSMMSNGDKDIDNSYQWSVSGKVVRVIDPETALSLDTLWDVRVSKAGAAGVSAGAVTLDYNEAAGAPDGSPQTNFTEPNWNEMFGMNLDKFEFLSHTGVVTFPKALGSGFVSASPNTYVPTDYYRKFSKAQKVVDYPSYALIAVSSPDNADVTNDIPTSLGSVQDWMQLQYLEDTAVDAYKQLMGGSASGDYELYRDAVLLIQGLAPKVMQDNQGFAETEWHAVANAFFDVEVPGRLQVKSIGDE